MMNNKKALADRGQNNGLRVGDNSKALRRGEDEVDAVTGKEIVETYGVSNLKTTRGELAPEGGDNKSMSNRCGDGQEEVSGGGHGGIKMGPGVDIQTFEKIIMELNRKEKK